MGNLQSQNKRTDLPFESKYEDIWEAQAARDKRQAQRNPQRRHQDPRIVTDIF